MKTHFHLVINEKAGSGNARKVAKQVIKQMQEQKIDYTTYYTDYAGHEMEIVGTLAENTLIPWSSKMDLDSFPLLLILGGDGTLHGAINALKNYHSAIPVSYIPSGSGNDFARGVGIPKDTKKALNQILNAQSPKEIEIINYNEEIRQEEGLAVNNIGIGIDATIVQVTNESASKKALNKFKLGSFSYILSIIRVLFTQKGFPILVEMNGKKMTFDRAFLCTVTTHPYFGGGVAIAPDADPRKPILDFVLVERINIFKILWLIFLLSQKKQMQSKYFHHFQTSKLRIISTIPQYGHADGEILGKKSYDISFTTQTRLFWF
ncbi:diacylglycerol/lipid kinase family protein [Enterococcus rivorum]|uniref:Diacylglycerol kinase n=1 Tax=Enterococcus rivorum TaxID=762845 RepID=A0A1E5KUP2_9ENTE|nr:diacylglycerol kinase family protein [Enterococcus rivorum]MBP2100592.1 YegS/Rv2252/BmrU family lipid kinase [Enterococcus rivorum]OEH81560.1 diacylglycerol kinase [Enterococcus rivorum]